MAKRKLFVDHQGRIIGLCDGIIECREDLIGSGPKRIVRAAHVEFNNDSQKWEVRSVAGEVVAEGNTRDEALAKEREWLYSDNRFVTLV